MRPILFLCAAAFVAGCAPSGERTDTPPLNLADIAGKWMLEFTAEGSDSVVVTGELTATSTLEGWTVTLAGRDPIPQHVVVGADSVVIHAGPYESVLRPGTMASAEGMFRLVDGRLEGWTVARYAVETPDSVSRFKVRGTRIP